MSEIPIGSRVNVVDYDIVTGEKKVVAVGTLVKVIEGIASGNHRVIPIDPKPEDPDFWEVYRHHVELNEDNEQNPDVLALQ